MGEPLASRQTPAACHSLPSVPRTNTQGENLAPGGASTHRPGSHDHRVRRQTHSPSSHTADRVGRSGTASTRPGGSDELTSSSALSGCGANGGRASVDVQPASKRPATMATEKCTHAL